MSLSHITSLLKRRCCCPCYSQLARCYHSSVSKPWIGPVLKSNHELDQFFNTYNWSVSKYLQDTSSITKDKLPSREVVLKLLKLSGLSSLHADIEAIQYTLARQLQLISKLHNAPVDTTELDPNHARLFPRENKLLTYETLMKKIECENLEPEEQLDSSNKSWKATDTATISKNGYFIFRHGLLKDRN
ncbi:glutamyl-tRNA(Gln) amidotransferase subunit F NDAI_0G01170 [Naumovozyma dairenensis CBS 421]|uniref:Glutamyl-tRNA(Gln) amidotransferase subunit F, mitochondrial n=1 Tax=Naumovozyma dairenensis (strain ATCC 10597 / BCRC 20456 / CBS 421 / NBRC 0211 / NRRL Y-12639) TaxID=1071378 RepID=G0WDN2_NAUDC|nr:hypothetical protein NDAI_0G01170 [Naumovozyma dairenensis CBS 421]CCD25893.2 hypothetical protein NDAI_0G01170 [Naumovozyma dairenensis CBS 421]